MRKVFSSQRLENVEAVAQLLRDAGIEVKIENGRSYRGHRRGNFSYDTRKQPEELPAVWILRSEDQPRGRQILRDMGLLESTRTPSANYVLTSQHTQKNTATGLTSKRIKLGLLALIAVGIGLIAFGTRLPQLFKKQPQQTAALPAPTQPALSPLVPETITELETYQADVPTALAALLIAQTANALHAEAMCISVDGKTPPDTVMQALADVPVHAFTSAQCPDKTFTQTDVSRYVTDGSGSGEITLTVNQVAQTLHVAREGHQWHIQGKH